MHRIGEQRCPVAEPVVPQRQASVESLGKDGAQRFEGEVEVAGDEAAAGQYPVEEHQGVHREERDRERSGVSS